MAEDQGTPPLSPEVAGQLAQSDIIQDEALRTRFQGMAQPVVEPTPIPEAIAAPQEEEQDEDAQNFIQNITAVPEAEPAASVEPVVELPEDTETVSFDLEAMDEEAQLRNRANNPTLTPAERMQAAQALKERVSVSDEPVLSADMRKRSIMEAEQKYQEALNQATEFNKNAEQLGLDTMALPKRTDYLSEADIEFGFKSGMDIEPGVAQSLSQELEDKKALEEEEQQRASIRKVAAQQSAQEKEALEAEKTAVEAKKKVSEKIDEAKGKYTSFEDLFENASTGRKVSAAIALVLGGIGQGLIGGQNAALQVFEKEFEDNLEKQKLAYDMYTEKLKLAASNAVDPLERQKLINAQLDGQKKAMEVEDKMIIREIASMGGNELSEEVARRALSVPETAKRLVKYKGKTFSVGDAAEARKLKEDTGEIDTAVNALDELIRLSEQGARLPSADRARAKTLLQAAVGKLRLPLTGPGPLTDTEFSRLVNTLGDPTKFLTLQSWEREKLKTVKGLLEFDLKNKFKVGGVNIPMSDREKAIKQLTEKFPNKSYSEIVNALDNLGKVPK
jgi:hypothetical protein